MGTSRRVSPPAQWAGAATGLVLLAVYLLTLAPDVTLWDSAELTTAFHTLGVPHPPGTPLFVLIGRVWTWALAPLGVAQAANVLSAVSTAAACGLLASLLARWTGRTLAALAAGISAGVGSTVWLNATETEVYSVALLLAAVTLFAADRAGREEDVRWTVLVGYLLALAVPLHLFALVAAPGAVALASTSEGGRWRTRRLLSLSIVLLGVVAVGTVRLPLLAAAGAAAAALEMYRRQRRGTVMSSALAVTPLLSAAALGLSVIAVMVIRARFDPFLNEGNPVSLSALSDVIARRQYSVASLWPRQAPLWLQIGNVLEYADWQFALALAPGPLPDWGRTAVTVLFATLGLAGAAVHRRCDRRSWRAMLLLMTSATVGVVLYLNLKAGPSFGHGVLAVGTPREARERDYFFVFAFWLWGAWAGLGAVALSGRLQGGIERRLRSVNWRLGASATAAGVGLLVAASPIVLNWSAVDRRRGADATLAADVGRALLGASPARAVLLTAGDLDSYPIWYRQAVHGERGDVTVVVIPMLPAAWYRAELARRNQLLPWPDGGNWKGEEATVRQIAEAAGQQDRPLAASALLERAALEAAGGDWAAAGVVNLRQDVEWRAGDVGTRRTEGFAVLDGTTAARTVALVRRQLPRDGPLPSSMDPAARRMRSLLECARLVAEGAASPTDSTVWALLDSRCNLP